MNGIATGIETFFGSGQDLSTYLAALGLIGLATMALIQTIKDTTPVRRWFQQARVRRWIAEGAADATERHGKTLAALNKQSVDPQKAEACLVALSVDGDREALYDLTLEQMCGQMTTALQVVLDNPVDFADLLLVAASEAAPNDLFIVTTTDRANLTDREGKPTPEQIRYSEARTLVMHQLQRAVDGFQISAGYRWKFWLQVASFVTSFALAAVAVGTKGAETGVVPHIGVIIFTALLAGFLAPVARDLTAALQSLRRT